ncbi:MAG: galactokinase [Candidatus Dormibacteria bacterium]
MALPVPARVHDLAVVREAVRLLTSGEDDVHSHVGYAPGRMTVIGDHIDYVGGDVLCCAINRGIAVALAPGSCRVWSIRDETRTELLESLDTPSAHFGRVLAALSWARRKWGGDEVLSCALSSDLPRSVGLSSSAAVVIATLRAYACWIGKSMSSDELAEGAYQVEHDELGIPSGHLDQYAICRSREQALHELHCHTMTSTFIPWDSNKAVFIVCDTGIEHAVADSPYGSRVHSMQDALHDLGVSWIGACPREEKAPRKRNAQWFHHCLTEEYRVRDAVEVVRRGDVTELGQLMTASHVSLRDDYEVSHGVCDALVDALTRMDGCLGARITGAGFGGCVVALVEASRADIVLKQVQRLLPTNTDHTGDAWTCIPGAGVAELYDMAE